MPNKLESPEMMYINDAFRNVVFAAIGFLAGMAFMYILGGN